MSGELSFGLAVVAGVLSFLSPCVLPLVPAYLGQLTAVAVAGAGGDRPSRWLAFRHAAAYVAGFTTVFTFLGVTATYAAGPLFDYVAPARTIGGAVLVVLGASLAGLVRLPFLERVWRPLEPAAQAGLAGRTGGVVVAVEAPTGPTSGLGRWLAQTRSGPLVSFALGAIFAVGWTPCIGVVLGAILTLAANSATAAAGGLLLVGFSLGLGVPFLALGLLYDRAPALVRPLVRQGRLVSLLGGLLVAAIGLAMIFDWLILLPRWFGFFSLV